MLIGRVAMASHQAEVRGVHVGLAGEDELRRFAMVAALGLIVLNACDLLLTRHLISIGATEANPLMAPIVSGWWGYVIKIGVPSLLALRYITAPVFRRVSLGLGAVFVLYCGVVLWNLHVLTSRYG